MVGVSLENILQQVTQLPPTEQQFLKQWFNGQNFMTGVRAEPELSLTQAAELLSVSTGFVENLLARGELKSVQTADSAAVRLSDLLAYKKQNEQETARMLDELTAQAQELKMGYE